MTLQYFAKYAMAISGTNEMRCRISFYELMKSHSSASGLMLICYIVNLNIMFCCVLFAVMIVKVSEAVQLVTIRIAVNLCLFLKVWE